MLDRPTNRIGQVDSHVRTYEHVRNSLVDNALAPGLLGTNKRDELRYPPFTCSASKSGSDSNRRTPRLLRDLLGFVVIYIQQEERQISARATLSNLQ